MSRRFTVALVCVATILVAATQARADDWPEFRGKGRLGVWHETGILEEFPAEGLKALWRTPIKAGFAGPAVADGRVFITDFEATHGMRGTERALALDEATGRILWTQEWEADYAGIQWETGPGATPTVDGDRVYTLGRTGVLSAFDVETGALLWRKRYAEDYGVDRLQWGFDWGFASAPLVDGPRLIGFVGGPENARVVAFDKMTGEEIWRALDSEADLGVAQPIIIEAGGARQLIVWNPEEVVSLDPTNGEFYWRQPYTVGGAMTVATPVQVGSQLFFTTFYDGPLMLTLDQDRPGATVAWKGSSNSEIQTDGLHAVLATPIIDGGTIYGICSYGQLRGLNAETGERLWETQEVGHPDSCSSTRHVKLGGRSDPGGCPPRLPPLLRGEEFASLSHARTPGQYTPSHSCLLRLRPSAIRYPPHRWSQDDRQPLLPRSRSPSRRAL